MGGQNGQVFKYTQQGVCVCCGVLIVASCSTLCSLFLDSLLLAGSRFWCYGMKDIMGDDNNANYSWLKGTKYVKGNLARFQPAKAEGILVFYITLSFPMSKLLFCPKLSGNW